MTQPKVLLVERDGVVREFIAEQIRRKIPQILILTALSGKSAVQRVDQNKNEIVLVLVGLDIPWDGNRKHSRNHGFYSFLSHMKRPCNELGHVIFAAISPMKEYHQFLMNQGCHFVLRKHFGDFVHYFLSEKGLA